MRGWCIGGGVGVGDMVDRVDGADVGKGVFGLSDGG